MYITIAPFVYYLISKGFDLHFYKCPLIGALSIMTAYILINNFSPEIIKKFNNIEDYKNDLLRRRKSLDYFQEFPFLTDVTETIITKYDLACYLPVHDGIQIFGEETVLSRLGNANFFIENRKKKTLRIILMIFLVIGIILIYLNILKYVYIIIFS